MSYVFVNGNDPILRQEMDKFEFNGEVDPWQLAEDLVKLMREKNGLGLSANQVGLPYNVFVMEGQPALACFNPRIVDVSSEEIALEEGCLSFPNLYVKVKRPRTVKVRFQDPNGDTHTKTFGNISARVFLHEMDHIKGIDFRKRANRYHLEKAQNQKRKLDKGILKADSSKLVETLKAANV